MDMKTIDMSAAVRKLSENKYVLLMLVLGIVLLILPSSVKSDSADTVSYPATSGISENAGRDGEMLGRILAQIDGVGTVRLDVRIVIAKRAKRSHTRNQKR